MDRIQFLNLRTKPAVSDVDEASWILSLHRDHVLYLVSCRHLLTLDDAPPGGQKYFMTSYLFALAANEKWLAKAIRLIRRHIQVKNQNRKLSSKSGSADEMAA
jgi:hypothetical protein